MSIIQWVQGEGETRVEQRSRWGGAGREVGWSGGRGGVEQGRRWGGGRQRRGGSWGKGEGGWKDRKKQPLTIFAVVVGVASQSWANVAPCNGESTLEPPNGLACSIGKQTCSALYRTGVAAIERGQVLFVLNGDFSRVRNHNKQSMCLQHQRLDRLYMLSHLNAGPKEIWKSQSCSRYTHSQPAVSSSTLTYVVGEHAAMASYWQSSLLFSYKMSGSVPISHLICGCATQTRFGLNERTMVQGIVKRRGGRGGRWGRAGKEEEDTGKMWGVRFHVYSQRSHHSPTLPCWLE